MDLLNQMKRTLINQIQPSQLELVMLSVQTSIHPWFRAQEIKRNLIKGARHGYGKGLQIKRRKWTNRKRRN